MKKNIIKIIVQRRGESGDEFGQTLTHYCNGVSDKYNLTEPPNVTLTSASDGRLTAMIQYQAQSPTNELIANQSEAPLFNGEHLRIAQERYKADCVGEYNFNRFFNFLLRQVKKDY